MVFAAAGIVGIILCWITGSWKRWRVYYPTILFFIMGNLTCDLLLYRKPLWEFTDIIGAYMYLSIGLMILLYPGTVILYFTYMPGTFGMQILYVLLWTAIYASIEVISMLMGLFSHNFGWNILFTVLHNIVMFLLLLLHFKRPLLAWPAAFLLAFLIMLAFGIPVEIAR